jgi:hypothetical protein
VAWLALVALVGLALCAFWAQVDRWSAHRTPGSRALMIGVGVVAAAVVIAALVVVVVGSLRP